MDDTTTDAASNWILKTEPQETDFTAVNFMNGAFTFRYDGHMRRN